MWNTRQMLNQAYDSARRGERAVTPALTGVSGALDLARPLVGQRWRANA